MDRLIGLGDANATMRVYMANRPDFVFTSLQSQFVALQKGQITAVGQTCGNGWRKVFNVYAKLMFALSGELPITVQRSDFDNWQAYRDQRLLQSNSNTALVFGGYQAAKPQVEVFHLIMGKTYANSLSLPASLQWLDREFAIEPLHGLIVCPYFDYRQLSDIKIIRLVALLSELNHMRAGRQF